MQSCSFTCLWAYSTSRKPGIWNFDLGLHCFIMSMTTSLTPNPYAPSDPSFYPSCFVLVGCPWSCMVPFIMIKMHELILGITWNATPAGCPTTSVWGMFLANISVGKEGEKQMLITLQASVWRRDLGHSSLALTCWFCSPPKTMPIMRLYNSLPMKIDPISWN